MKVLITGATGFVGRPLTRSLVARGHDVTALTRDVHGATAKLPARCACVHWNPDTRAIDPEIVGAADVIVHLAGEGVADKPWSDERKQAIMRSRVDSSRALVNAIRELAPERRPQALIAASAIGYYGDRPDEILTEQSNPGSGFLADVCQAWERESQAAQSLGVRSAAIRIGVVLGKDGGALAKMLPPFQLGAGGRLGDGTHWMSWIHLDDLVDLFVRVTEDAALSGIFNGVAPAPLTNADFTKTLGRSLNRPTLIPVPRFALDFALGEMASILFDSQRVLPKAAQAAGFEFRYPELAAALAQILDGVHEIHAEQWVSRPIGEVFDFYSDAHNLESLTPEFLKFRVVGTSTPKLEAGTTIDYKLSLHGVPVSWQSRIGTWEPGKRFVDEQVKGPYSLWHHTHEFEEYRGGTIVRDHVRYRLPLGGFGDALSGPLVKRDLRNIFDFRRERVRELFAGA